MTTRNHKTFSITIRPKNGIGGVDIEEIKRWLDDKKYRYVIGLEQKNHYQMAIQLDKGTTTSNLRRKLVQYIEWQDGDIEKIALVIRKHWDWNYLIGYCSKEYVLHSNLTLEEHDKANEYYKKGEGKYVQPSYTWRNIKWNIDDFVNNFVNWLRTCKYAYSHELLMRYCNKNKDKFSYNTYQKINKTTLEEYCGMYNLDIFRDLSLESMTCEFDDEGNQIEEDLM